MDLLMFQYHKIIFLVMAYLFAQKLPPLLLLTYPKSTPRTIFLLLIPNQYKLSNEKEHQIP